MLFKDNTLEGIIRSLISDEWLAWNQYSQNMIVAQGKQLNFLNKIFDKNGKDEYDDHYKRLVNWAQSKHIPVPTDFDVMQQICNTRFVPVNDPTDTKPLLDLMIKAEDEAIAAYTQAMNEEAIKVFPDLVVILGEICNDEREHMKELEDVKSALVGIQNVAEPIPADTTAVNASPNMDITSVGGANSMQQNLTNFCKKMERIFNIKVD